MANEVTKLNTEVIRRKEPSALRSLVARLTPAPAPAVGVNRTEQRIIRDSAIQSAEIGVAVEAVLSAAIPADARAHIAELEQTVATLRTDREAVLDTLDRLQSSPLGADSQRSRQRAFRAAEDNLDEATTALQAAHAALVAAHAAQADLVRRHSLQQLQQAEVALAAFDAAHRVERNALWSAVVVANAARSWLKNKNWF